MFTELPDKTGVYLFIDRAYNVVYVGKAKSLKKRVLSHFRRSLDARHISMLSQVRTVEYITAKNEREALLLEEQLIKELKPRYNISLRDDKTYPYLEITKGEKFPELKITRKRTNPNSIYFGPFPNVSDIRSAKRVTEKIFPLRKCRSIKFKKNTIPCLNYQIKRCLSPCTEKINMADYSQMVNELTLFFSGSSDELLKKLNNRMEYFKNKQCYEDAATVRDQIVKLENFFPIVHCHRVTKKKLKVLKKIDRMYLLKEILNMKIKPSVIEGFDISHTSSKEAVGSMVYFKGGEPVKSKYRKFKIKQPPTADDLKMLGEVIGRRIKGLLKNDEALPDILLIDGGRGQEGVAGKIIKKYNLNIKVLAFAKDKGNIYYNGQILKIDRNSPVFRLFKKIANESHRFAHSYHILRRSKEPYLLI